MSGGFPQQMLMEDVELLMRLKEHGSLCFLPNGVIVSTRRWKQTGFLPNFLKVIWLCLTYLLQRRLGLVDANAQSFYDSVLWCSFDNIIVTVSLISVDRIAYANNLRLRRFYLPLSGIVSPCVERVVPRMRDNFSDGNLRDDRVGKVNFH